MTASETGIMSAEFVRDILSYDEKTGVLRWKVKPGQRVRVGEIAGRPDKAGYRRITIKQKDYLSHRLAWLITYGEWPEDALDHIDRNKSNNAISNLRIAMRWQNRGNTGLMRNNTSGRRGVSWLKREKKWRAAIGVRGRTIFLGSFDDIEDAARTYEAAAQKHFGDFFYSGSSNVALEAARAALEQKP